MDLKTALISLGVDDKIAAIIFFIMGLVVFALKFFDKSEYELLLSNYFNKLLVYISRTLPFYIIIFLISSITFVFDNSFNTKETVFVDIMTISLLFISMVFFAHIIMVQLIGLTNIKYDYYIYIDDNPKKRIIKLINNEIMVVEKTDTKEIEFTTKWKDSKIEKIASNKGILKDFYDDLKYKKAIWFSIFLSILAILIYRIGDLSDNIGYTIIFRLLGLILFFSIVNVWGNIFTIKWEKKINKRSQT